MLKVNYKLICDFCEKEISNESFIHRIIQGVIPIPRRRIIHLAWLDLCEECNSEIGRVLLKVEKHFRKKNDRSA